MRAQITIDAIQNGSYGSAQTNKPKSDLKSFHNYYETKGGGVYPVFGASIDGAENFDVTTDVQEWMSKNPGPENTEHKAIDNSLADKVGDLINDILKRKRATGK